MKDLRQVSYHHIPGLTASFPLNPLTPMDYLPSAIMFTLISSPNKAVGGSFEHRERQPPVRRCETRSPCMFVFLCAQTMLPNSESVSLGRSVQVGHRD